MFTIPRKALFLASIALAAATNLAAAPDTSKAAVHGEGTSFSGGVTKYFEFNAVQKSEVSLLAHGGVWVAQVDSSGAFGDFEIAGKVKCLKLNGNSAVIGLIITAGGGTAATHVGEAFYLVAQDNAALLIPDGFDNSGYTGTSATDCNLVAGFVSNVIEGDIRVRQDN